VLSRGWSTWIRPGGTGEVKEFGHFLVCDGTFIAAFVGTFIVRPLSNRENPRGFGLHPHIRDSMARIRSNSDFPGSHGKLDQKPCRLAKSSPAATLTAAAAAKSKKRR
jgi:hypothetical protein